MNRTCTIRTRTTSITLALLLCGSAGWAQKPAVVPEGTEKPQTPGEDIDRIVATVNGELILDSDLDKEMRFEKLTADDGVEKEPTTNPAATGRAQLLERMINRDLILQQIKVQNDDPLPKETVDQQIAAIRSTLSACKQFHCETDAGWAAYLKTQGFTPADFRESWRDRMSVLLFIEQRFRTGIRVDQQRVSDYYNKTMLPEYKAKGVKAPPLDSLSERIQDLLVEQEVSKLLSDWLQSLRSQGGIVVLHPGQVAP
jgi:peptidyl-prolyl cis-trans isomerase SurA